MKKLIILAVVAMCAGCAHINPDCSQLFQQGLPHGQGTFTSPDDTKYTGGWKDGKFHGLGTYTYPDGSKFIRRWKDGKCVGRRNENTTASDGSALSDTKLKICISMALLISDLRGRIEHCRKCEEISSFEDGNVRLELWTLQLSNYIELQDYVNTINQAHKILRYIREETHEGRHPEVAEHKLRSEVFFPITPQIECIASMVAADAWIKIQRPDKVEPYVGALFSSRCPKFFDDAIRISGIFEDYEEYKDRKRRARHQRSYELAKRWKTRATKKTSQGSIFDYCQNNPNECILGGFIVTLMGASIYESVKADNDRKQALKEAEEREEREQRWCADNPRACAQKREQEEAEGRADQRARQSCYANCEAQTSKAQCAGMSDRGWRSDRDDCLHDLYESRRRCKEACP